VPAVRTQVFDTDPGTVAHSGLVAIRRAGAALHELVDGTDDAGIHGPSRLPGWTRGHVVSHLARNADGLVNLLGWARTGIEHPMYASPTDREADIAEGAPRLAVVQQEDLRAAQQRFLHAADGLSPVDWTAHVTDRRGRPVAASLVPWMRLTEVLVHQVDLDLGADFDRAAELVGPQAELFIDYVVTRYDNRRDVPPLRLVIELSDGSERVWVMGHGDDAREVRGSVGSAMAWLTGREYTGSGGLSGEVPKLPPWL
jgi:maleylpyruvate isomerase